MVDIYSFELSVEKFDKLLQGKFNNHLVVNETKYKNLAVGNKITFVRQNDDANADVQNINAIITNLYYFADVKEAVDTLGKEHCGFKNSNTLEKASDLFISNANFEKIEKLGILAIAFELIND